MKLRREIQTFKQKDENLFFEAWEHFNEQLLNCPYHNLSQGDQVQAFYEGLSNVNKGLVDLACGGMLMEKSSEETIELFKTISENSQQFSSRRMQELKGKSIHEEDTDSGVQIQMATIERKLDMLVKAMTSHYISHIQQSAQIKVCAICSHYDHIIETCPMFEIVDQESKKNDLEDTLIQFLSAQ